MLALVERYEGRVFGLCYRMLGQREDAEDMTQETFTRALRFLHKWDSERAFEPWLLAICDILIFLPPAFFGYDFLL